VADTLEELAELMGVPVDNFVATINKWNEMCDAGEDTEFGSTFNIVSEHIACGDMCEIKGCF
jgi:hypothetical protein